MNLTPRYRLLVLLGCGLGQLLCTYASDSQETKQHSIHMVSGWIKQLEDISHAMAYNDQPGRPVLAISHPDKNVHLISQAAKIVAQYHVSDPCSAVSFTHGGNNLAVGTMAPPEEASEISCFDLEKDALKYKLTTYSDTDFMDGVHEIHFSPDNKLGLFVQESGSVYIWDCLAGNFIDRINLPKCRIRSARFINNNTIALMTDKGTIEHHELGKPGCEIFSLAKHGANFKGSPILSCDGSSFLGMVHLAHANKEASLWICNLITQQLFKYKNVKHTHSKAVNFDDRFWACSDGRWVTVFLDLFLQLKELSDNACCFQADQTVSAIACHPNGRECVVATWPHEISSYKFEKVKQENKDDTTL